MRFQIENQSENHFQIPYIKLGDEAGYTNPGTKIMDVKKEDDLWKLDEETFIPSSEQALVDENDMMNYISNSSVTVK